MSRMVKAASAVAVSTTFDPNDREVIDLLRLHPMLHGEFRRYVIAADVYSAHPYYLAAKHAQPASGTGDAAVENYYFFSPVHPAGASTTKKSRIVAGTNGKGKWHMDGRKEVQGSTHGYKTTFTYGEKTSSGRFKGCGWRMVEYSIQGHDIVIAKIYRSAPPWAMKDLPRPYFAGQHYVDDQVNVHPNFINNADDSVEPHSHQGLPQLYFAGQHYVDYQVNDHPNFINNADDSVEPHSHQGLPQLYFAGQHYVDYQVNDHPNFINNSYDSVEPHSHQAGLPQLYFAGQHYVDYQMNDHPIPNFINNDNAVQYNISGGAAAAHGAHQFQDLLANDYPDFAEFNNNNGSHGATSPTPLPTPQHLARQYNVSSSTAAFHGTPQFQQAVVATPTASTTTTSQETGTWCTPMPSSSRASTWTTLQEMIDFLMSDDDDAAP